MIRFRRNGVGHDLQSVEASLQEVNDRAAETYQPQPYDGRVIVFKPRVNYNFYPDPQMGWGNMVMGELKVIELPVNPHAMLVEPFVQALAARLREEMENGCRSVRKVFVPHGEMVKSTSTPLPDAAVPR